MSFFSCSSVASDASCGSSSLTYSNKQHVRYPYPRKHSVQWSRTINMSVKGRRASINPTFNTSSSSNAIDEEGHVFSTKEVDQTQKKPNTAKRIEIIRRTMRRQSTSNVPIQPPKHSIMAGFAGFLNMTTATCNTGVPSERRMSIPVAVHEDNKKLNVDSPKTKLPYSSVQPYELSQISEQKDHILVNRSTSQTILSSGTGGVGKLRTRLSDSSVVVGNRCIHKSRERSASTKNPCIILSDAENDLNDHLIRTDSTESQNDTAFFGNYNEKIGYHKNAWLGRNRMRSGSIVTKHPEIFETSFGEDGLNRERNNSDLFVTMQIEGKFDVKV